jgi:2'-5' RNA ligase
MREIKNIRLFFALWPNEGIRDEISSCVKLLSAHGGRVVSRYNWHMTLHFIGNTTFAQKDCLHDQAKKVNAKPFDLRIRQKR